MSLQNFEVAAGVILRIDPFLERMRLVKSLDLMACFGRSFNNQEFPYGEFQHRSVGDRCFDAAFDLAESSGLGYVEGFVTFKGSYLCLMHGWCCDDERNVIDPTLHRLQHRGELTYIGIRFNQEYARWWKGEVGYHGMLDGHVDGLPIGVYHDSPEKFLWQRKG